MSKKSLHFITNDWPQLLTTSTKSWKSLTLFFWRMRCSTWWWKLSTDMNVWSGSKYFRVTDDAYHPSELTSLRRAVYKYQFLFCAVQDEVFCIPILSDKAYKRACYFRCWSPPYSFMPKDNSCFILSIFWSTNRSNCFIKYHNTFVKDCNLQSRKPPYINRYNLLVVSLFPTLFLAISFSCFGCSFNMKLRINTINTSNKCWFSIFSIFILLT